MGGHPDVPSVYACYRFTAKLRVYSEMLDRCIDGVTASPARATSGHGRERRHRRLRPSGLCQRTAVAFQNGPERERYNDPDASWGHRSAVSTRKGGGFYGYKVHAAVCTITGLPVAWTVETASAAETNFTLPLIDASASAGSRSRRAIMDKSCDNGLVHEGCMDRGVYPVSPLRETYAVKRDDHHAPKCEHGAGRSPEPTSSARRPKWRCPTRECQPKSRGSRLTVCTR